MDFTPDTEECERQRFADFHRHERQLLIGSSAFVLLLFGADGFAAAFVLKLE